MSVVPDDDVAVEHFVHWVPRYYLHCHFSLQLADLEIVDWNFVFMGQNNYILQLCLINNQDFKYIPDKLRYQAQSTIVYIPDKQEEYRQVQEEICTFQTSFLTKMGMTCNPTIKSDRNFVSAFYLPSSVVRYSFFLYSSTP